MQTGTGDSKCCINFRYKSKKSREGVSADEFVTRDFGGLRIDVATPKRTKEKSSHHGEKEEGDGWRRYVFV